MKLPLLDVMKMNTKNGTRCKTSVMISAVVVLLWAAAAAWPSQIALIITDERTGSAVFAAAANPGDSFVIRFIHSVHGTPVEEHFVLTKNLELVLTKVVYESYGAGNPSGVKAGERFSLRDGKIIIDGMNRTMKMIRLRTGQIAADHELKIHQERLALGKLAQPGSLVVMQAKRVSPFFLWRTGSVKDLEARRGMDEP